MHRHRTVMLAALALGCGGGGGGNGSMGPPPVTAASVTVALSGSTTFAAGETRQATATAKAADGSVIANPAVTWSSSNASVASVSGTGTSATVTGESDGAAAITAKVGAAQGMVNVTVQTTATPAATVTTPGLSFEPPTVTITAGGTVTWSVSGTTHSVVFNSTAPEGGNVPNTAPGGSASRTFATPGRYAYHCGIHGASMSGTVVVR